jgi:hypothetical protein
MHTENEVEQLWLDVLRSRLPTVTKTLEGIEVKIDDIKFTIAQKSTVTGSRILRSR